MSWSDALIMLLSLLYSWRFSRYNTPIHWLVHGHDIWQWNCFLPNAMSGQHCKNYDVKRELLHVIAGISARFSNFAFVLFCFITNQLMIGPLGNSEFCFPRISMFPKTKLRETLRLEGNKIHCSPRDQSLSVNCLNHHTMLFSTVQQST